MNEFEDELDDLKRALAALRAEVVTLHGTDESDVELIAGLRRCDASMPELKAMARRLRPFVRAQILRGAIWRGEVATSGHDLGFVPVWPMEIVVEICAHPVGQAAPDELVELLDRDPQFDLEGMLKLCRNRALAEISWRKDVELLVIQTAIETPDCLELRRLLDEAADNEVMPSGWDRLAADKEMALVAPLGGPPRHYPIVSDLDHFPFTSDKWR